MRLQDGERGRRRHSEHSWPLHLSRKVQVAVAQRWAMHQFPPDASRARTHTHMHTTTLHPQQRAMHKQTTQRCECTPLRPLLRSRSALLGVLGCARGAEESCDCSLQTASHLSFALTHNTHQRLRLAHTKLASGNYGQTVRRFTVQKNRKWLPQLQ